MPTKYSFLTGNYYADPNYVNGFKGADYEPDFFELADGDEQLAECLGAYYDYIEPYCDQFDENGKPPWHVMDLETFKDEWYAEHEEVEHAA